ncbi:hypothetical protein [Paenibacillus qinlingensis]|uniref:Fibronectin type III domain-containing protein n=1 Tax=Paenibacillus qinlingensis TaxID=1837343 RepID=A0ABU1P4P0_9BACL|nr:hypothetical protein [Paenibacillus qinlingensis]MDR6554663.1 hypothetical protein [Paenibacillus qinlingensis]
MKIKMKNEKWSIIIFVLSLFLVILVWALSGYGINNYYENLEEKYVKDCIVSGKNDCLSARESIEGKRGTFGDMFGAVNSLFSGLAFAGIIYTIYLQRKELTLQREEIQKSTIPVILIKEASFAAFKGKNSSYLLKWSNNRSDESADFKLEFFNIGLGAAKNIQLSWSYDVQSLIDRIHKNNNANVYRLTYDSKTQRIEINSTNHSYYFLRDLEYKTDYILPVNVINESTKIELPSSYLLFCSVLLDVFDNEEAMNWPLLNLKINYRDVVGNQYTRGVTLKPSIYVIQRVSSDPLITFGHFEIIDSTS